MWFCFKWSFKLRWFQWNTSWSHYMEQTLCSFSLYSGVVSTGVAISFLFISFCPSFQTWDNSPEGPCHMWWVMWRGVVLWCQPLYLGEDICACYSEPTDTHLHLCEHPPKEKNAVCTGMLSGWPRDRLVITSVSLSGLNYRASGKSPLLSSLLPLPHLCVGQPVCRPSAGLTSYLINMDRPLVHMHTHTHTHTHILQPCSQIGIHMDMLRDSLTHVDTVNDRHMHTPHTCLHPHADNHRHTHIDLALLWVPRYD